MWVTPPSQPGSIQTDADVVVLLLILYFVYKRFWGSKKPSPSSIQQVNQLRERGREEQVRRDTEDQLVRNHQIHAESTLGHMVMEMLRFGGRREKPGRYV